jgi:hypothetical protein
VINRAAQAINAREIGRAPAHGAVAVSFHRRCVVIAATTYWALWRPFHTAG